MKKFLVFLLSLTICLTPTITFAGAAEKWNLIENVYDKSKNTVKVEARKVAQTAANSARYKVEVPVNASTLGSSVKRLLWAGLAVSAITALIEGVGWIIDTGSQTIKKPVDKSPDLPTFEYVWANGYSNQNFATSSQAAQMYLYVLQRYNNDLVALGPVTIITINQVKYDVLRKNGTYHPQYITVTRIKNPKYNPALAPEYEVISDERLGNEVLGKGTEPNSKPDPASDIITQAYSPNSPTLGGSETDTALDNAPPNPDKEPNGDTKPKPNVDTDGDGVPDKYDPEKPSVGDQFELPSFCSWAVTVCEWYSQYKTDSKNVETHRVKELSFWEKVQDYMNWSREPPEKDDSDNDVPVKTPEAFDNSVFSKDRFAVSRQCPIPEQHTISLSGVSVNFSFDMTPLCQVLILARPALVACSYLYAAYIVIGAARNG